MINASPFGPMFPPVAGTAGARPVPLPRVVSAIPFGSPGDLGGRALPRP